MVPCGAIFVSAFHNFFVLISMNLDLSASFKDVEGYRTPFGYFDNDLAFQSACDSMVRFVYTKLGGRTLGIEITNFDVYACVEESMLEYSGMVNSYQAKSVISSLLGSSTGSMTDGKMPRFSLDQLVRQADAYSSEALVGGTRQLHSSSIMLEAGTQRYDLQHLLSQSGDITANDRIRIEQVMHFSPTSGYLYLDAATGLNYLNQEFKFESLTPDKAFYMLPVWEDLLRQQQLKTSEKVRRSNYSWNIINNELMVYPAPLNNLPIYFTYYIANDDPWKNSPSGVTTNLSNIPFSNLTYSSMNSLGQQWVRRFAFALAKEVLGQVRSKVEEVPIPDGALRLNGLELINQARDEQNFLREDLKVLLDSTTYGSLSQQQIDQADALQRQLSKIPTFIFVG